MIGIGATLFKVANIAGRKFIPSVLFANGEEGAWYDPSDLASMFQSSDGTTAAVVDQPVGYIRDKSGNGNHAIQATSDKRPTLRQSGSLYYLEFDGANDCLATSAIDFTGGDQMSVFAGAAKTASTNQVVAELSSSISSNNGSFRLFGSSTIWRYTSKGTNLVNGSASDYGIPSTSVLSATSDISADQLTFNVDGDQEANPTSDQGTGNYGNYALNIGSRDNGASLPLTGNIYGLVVRSTVSSAAEIAATEAYMATKSGVTL
tara:strand:- start:251 stop:1036 length:786 start_codon:yes stop_codon:yes gene_type:complete